MANSAKKDFEKIRKQMRSTLDSERNNFQKSLITRPAPSKASRNLSANKDFEKVRRGMQKTVKNISIKKEKSVKYTVAKHKAMEHKAIKLKISKKELRSVARKQKAAAENTAGVKTLSKREIGLAIQQLFAVKKEMKKIVVGQDDTVDSLLRAMLCHGHVLVEGVPGIAKTLIIRALAETLGCKFQRVQFTADLLPSDLVGINAYEKSKGFYTIKGPVFANFILADEINRAPPKVQAALLEAMQDRKVSIAKTTFDLPNPFFVMATQNPLESLGVYPLPQAQIDRFLFKVQMGYPSPEEEESILLKNITLEDFSHFKLKQILSPEKILYLQKLAKKIYLSDRIEKYIINIIGKTREQSQEGLMHFVQWGASPRASIGLYIGSKAVALMEGSSYVKPQHVKKVAHEVLRHRLLLNYEGQAEGIDTNDIVNQIISKVPVP
ncbi:MAG: AAA family ATPase [Candidatus Aenigmatarchaeota archaeon]